MKLRNIGMVLLLAAVWGCASGQESKPVHRVGPLAPPPKYTPEALSAELHERAVLELLTETKASDPFLRCNAIEAIAEADPGDAAGPIVKGLSDPETSVRFAAVMAAGKIKLMDAYPIVLQMAYDPDLRIQAAVRYALYKMGDTRQTRELESLAFSGDPHVRGTVAEVLGLMGEPSAASILMRLKADREPSVRIQAAEALWRLGDDRGLQDLVAYTISGYPDDQIIALQAIAATHDMRVIQHVRGELQSDYVEVSLSAARAAGMLGSDEGWNVAVPAAKSVDPRQRSMAALAMGAIGRPDLQPYLKDLLDDQMAAVRISAATAILQLHAPDGTPSVAKQ